MNYLSHYIIDHKPGQPYFNTGLIIPDIAKGFISTIPQTKFPAFSSDMMDLHDGCLQHVLSDKQFHGSDFFESFHTLVKDAMRTKPFSDQLNRKWFLAHILTELLIDRMFVKFEPELTDRFYEDLVAVELDVLLNFLKPLGLNDHSRFSERFNHFRQIQFIRYYTDNNKFIYSLNRIMLRIGEPEMGAGDAELMTDLFTELEKEYFAESTPIKQRLKSIFI